MSQRLMIKLHLSSDTLAALDLPRDTSLTTISAPSIRQPTTTRWNKRRDYFGIKTISEVEDWTVSKWHTYLGGNTSGNAYIIFEAMGLVTLGPPCPHPFTAQKVLALSLDVSRLAECISKSSSNEGIAQAAYDNTFDDAIEEVLERHRQKIWGRNQKNQSHLHTPTIGSVCKYKLVWQNSSDKKQ
ncbi:hypothetical protein CC86DRAFT_404374 [Ophiobolus disseminans]|uniref:Uncharacterized protein n=1 Tax=Ophiobolus disseminans TaxID=1469910 RepID=A0A6A7A590_9PLEO|nr:hypothetical protein CC86DRAFT_404374 [Ophiobolus disseminans]